MHLLCISPLLRGPFGPILASSRSSGLPRSLTIYAGDNKKQPNYIDIGVASRGGWDEVKIVRTTTPEPLDSKRHKPASKKSAQAPRTPVVIRPTRIQPLLVVGMRGIGSHKGCDVKTLILFIVVRGFCTCLSLRAFRIERVM